MKPTLIFDYDGTLHNTMIIYESAFRRCFAWLVESGYTQEQKISVEKIAGWLGMNSRDMWNSFLPELSDEIKEKASRMVGNTMVILSNCKIAYREANWEEFHLERWFSAFYDCESFGFAPKTEIINEVRKRFDSPFIMIGDRRSDLECAVACKSPFVGCLYGFGAEGELEGADMFAESVRDVPERIREAL